MDVEKVTRLNQFLGGGVVKRRCQGPANDSQAPGRSRLEVREVGPCNRRIQRTITFIATNETFEGKMLMLPERCFCRSG